MELFTFRPWYKWPSVLVLFFVVILSISFFFESNGKVVVERPRVEFNVPKEKVKKVVLKNGMKVLVFQTKEVPKVLVQIAYNVGSGVEESGERGLAHLIEHMIFKGTEKLSEGDIDAISRKYGASFNAFTGKDITSYYFEVNKNNWKPFVEILADCMQNARFDEQHLASELKTVIQELRMYKDNHWNLMFEKASELVYPANHPYHHPIIGYKEDLMTLSSQRLKDFYKKYYHPDKATLFIVGDVDIDEAVEFATKNFEVIPGAINFEEKLIPQDTLDIVNSIHFLYEDIQKELQGLYWKIPGLHSGNKILTSVVEGVLGQGEGSLLYRRLVDQEKIAMSVEVGSIQLKESGILFVLIDPKEGEAEHCKKIIKEELEKIIKQGIDSELLIKTIRQRERSFFSMLQSGRSLVYEWIQSFFSTNDEYAIFKRVDQFYDIDQHMVQLFVKQNLDPFLMSELKILPLPGDKREMWLHNKIASEELDAEILKNFVRTAPLEEARFVKTMPEPNPLDFTFPKPDSVFELDNGLKVILRQSKEFPLLYTACRFKESAFFTKSKEGQALEVMMHMLMEGSSGFTKEENVDFFELYGAGYSFDSVGGRLAAVNVAYKPLLERFFHVLTRPKFDKGALEKVKALFVDSFQRSKDNPQAIASRLIKTIVYKNHPYGWSFDDVIDFISGLTVADLKRMHETYVSPKNMILVFSGDFDNDKIKNTLKDVFGSWSGSDYKAVDLTKGEFVSGEEIDYPMLRDQVVLLLGKASDVNIYHPDYAPLKLLNFIAFGSLGSHLHALREKTGLFYAASGGWGEGATKIHGLDFLYALLSVDKVTIAEKQMKELVDRIAEQGIKQHELGAARQWYLKKLIDLIASNRAVAETLGLLEEFNLDFDYYDNILKRVQMISVDELNEICKKHFSSKDLARVRVGRV